MVTSIQLSKDGSAIVVDNREIQAVCHLCGDSKSFAVPSIGALNSSMVYNKPEKWALIFGGTLRNPKRFYICLECAKGMVRGKAQV